MKVLISLSSDGIKYTTFEAVLLFTPPPPPQARDSVVIKVRLLAGVSGIFVCLGNTL